MKNISFTYQFCAAIIGLLLFTGATLPCGLSQSAESLDRCDMMESHQMMNEVCDSGTDCNCSIEEVPTKIESKVLLTPVFAKATLQNITSQVDFPNPKPLIQRTRNLSKITEASPPLFLKNSTFLN